MSLSHQARGHVVRCKEYLGVRRGQGTGSGAPDRASEGVDVGANAASVSRSSLTKIAMVLLASLGCFVLGLAVAGSPGTAAGSPGQSGPEGSANSASAFVALTSA